MKKQEKNNIDAIVRLLELIEGVNRELELVKKMNSDLMIRQNLHLKKKYTKQLLDLLEGYALPIEMRPAA